MHDSWKYIATQILNKLRLDYHKYQLKVKLKLTEVLTVGKLK